MPAQAGIQLWAVELEIKLDPGLRWGDEIKVIQVNVIRV